MEIKLFLHGTDGGNCRDIYSFELDGKTLYVCRIPAPDDGKVVYYTMPKGKGEPDAQVKAGITFIHSNGAKETTYDDNWSGTGIAAKQFDFTWEAES